MTIVNCSVCTKAINKIPSVLKKNIKNYCSKNCYFLSLQNNGTRRGVKVSVETKRKMSNSVKGVKNHMFGKKASPETKNKMSASLKGKDGYWKGKKQTKETIEKRKIKLRIPCSKEKKEKIRAANTGKKRTIKQREQSSRDASEKYLKGWKPFKGSKEGQYFSDKINKNIHYRSSYELVAYKLLDKDDSVKFYEVEAIRIPYFWKEIKRYYIPDIKATRVDDSIEIIEIKAAWQLGDFRTIEKMLAAKNYCLKNNWKYSVWTERELFNG